MAFKVTLKTPEGESTIECPGEDLAAKLLEAAGKLWAPCCRALAAGQPMSTLQTSSCEASSGQEEACTLAGCLLQRRRGWRMADDGRVACVQQAPPVPCSCP